MAISRFIASQALVILLMASASAGSDASLPGHLTITGRVLMPDGSPAAEAIVSSTENPGAKPVRTDREGQFQISGEFTFDCTLHARSADETHQAILRVAPLLARTLARPVELKLARGREYLVSVLAAGKQVKGAQVAVLGMGFKVVSSTSDEGVAKLWVPADEKLNTLVAWHPELGAAGFRSYPEGLSSDPAQLTLIAPRLHTVRVLDDRGNPVPDLKLGVSAGLERKNGGVEWIIAGEVEQSHVLTGAGGEARVPWFPGDNAKYTDVDVFDANWKVDEIDVEKVPEGLTTVRVRPLTLVKGRLQMPEGVSAEGILVSGDGFGPGSRGDISRARAQADGSFSLPVACDHGYALRVFDVEWASDVWSGMILAEDQSVPPPVTLTAYPATPINVRVTRGPLHDPIANAWILLGSEHEFSWKDSQGKERAGHASSQLWLHTDARGSVLLGVGKGDHKVNLRAGKWDEIQTIDVQDGERKTVTFYRPWLKQRTLAGRLLLNDAPHKLAPTMAIRGAARESRFGSIEVKPVVGPDGTMTLEVDAPEVTVFALDAAERVSGNVRAGPTAESIDLILSPTAVFSGVVVDANDKPLPNANLDFVVAGTELVAADAQVSDEQGRFQFAAVAANIPVSLQIRQKNDASVIHTDARRLFLPGEVRENARIVVGSNDSVAEDSQRGKSPPLSLAARVRSAARDARLNGMHALVVLQGDDSDGVAKLTERVQDYDELPAVLGYLPVVVDAKTASAELPGDNKYAWQLPAAGEVVLIALGGSAQELGSLQLKAGKLPEATRTAATFLKQRAPPIRDAKTLLAAAQEEAKRSVRRVWIVVGGPRCGPCLKLARWMDEQRALLDKDYVVVKILLNDLSAEEVMERLNQPQGSGIPWMAVTEPDGTVLTTGDGPLGNIGFPASIEESRHLRAMLRGTARQLTEDEQDKLVTSLSARDR